MEMCGSGWTCRDGMFRVDFYYNNCSPHVAPWHEIVNIVVNRPAELEGLLHVGSELLSIHRTRREQHRGGFCLLREEEEGEEKGQISEGCGN